MWQVGISLQLQSDLLKLTSQSRVIWQLQGDRVAVAAGIRLSTWMVQKVDTLDGFLPGIVNPDDDFDSTNRSGWSRAVRWYLDIS